MDAEREIYWQLWWWSSSTLRDLFVLTASNKATLPTPNMTVSNYGPSIHRQNHRFPPLPITLKISCPSYNFTASLTFASGAGLAASSAVGHPIHDFTNTRSDGIVLHLDCPRSPVREASMDLFPWATTLLPHLAYRLILFWCPSDVFSLTLWYCWVHLRMCYNVVRGCSLCGRLLVGTYAQCFGKDREMEVLRDMW